MYEEVNVTMIMAVSGQFDSQCNRTRSSLLVFVVKHVEDCRYHVHFDEESVASGLAAYEICWAYAT